MFTEKKQLSSEAMPFVTYMQGFRILQKASSLNNSTGNAGTANCTEGVGIENCKDDTGTQ